jgi:hypothetical protein
MIARSRRARRPMGLFLLAGLLLLAATRAGMADVVGPPPTPKPPPTSVSPTVSPAPSVSSSGATVDGPSGSGKTVAPVGGGAAVLVIAAASVVGPRRIAGGDRGRRPGPQGPVGSGSGAGRASGGEVDG